MGYREKVLREKFEKIGELLKNADSVIYSPKTKTYFYGEEYQPYEFHFVTNEDGFFTNIIIKMNNKNNEEIVKLSADGKVVDVVMLEDKNPKRTNISLISRNSRICFAIVVK